MAPQARFLCDAPGPRLDHQCPSALAQGVRSEGTRKHPCGTPRRPSASRSSNKLRSHRVPGALLGHLKDGRRCDTHPSVEQAGRQPAQSLSPTVGDDEQGDSARHWLVGHQRNTVHRAWKYHRPRQHICSAQARSLLCSGSDSCEESLQPVASHSLSGEAPLDTDGSTSAQPSLACPLSTEQPDYEGVCAVLLPQAGPGMKQCRPHTGPIHVPITDTWQRQVELAASQEPSHQALPSITREKAASPGSVTTDDDEARLALPCRPGANSTGGVDFNISRAKAWALTLLCTPALTLILFAMPRPRALAAPPVPAAAAAATSSSSAAAAAAASLAAPLSAQKGEAGAHPTGLALMRKRPLFAQKGKKGPPAAPSTFGDESNQCPASHLAFRGVGPTSAGTICLTGTRRKWVQKQLGPTEEAAAASSETVTEMGFIRFRGVRRRIIHVHLPAAKETLPLVPSHPPPQERRQELVCDRLAGVAQQRKAAMEGATLKEWTVQLLRQALRQGISRRVLALLRGLRPLEPVLSRDRNKPEVKLTARDYVARLVTEQRVKQGLEQLERHEGLLRRLEEEYGVPPHVLVAVWGIESSYGQYTGNWDTLQALLTLAFRSSEPRRAAFFRSELLHLLHILDKRMTSLSSPSPSPSGAGTAARGVSWGQRLGALHLKGSYAGAMGQCQFMPSSFLAYAVDYDNDGFPDIWNSTEDVLASMANYLIKNGWRKGEPLGWQVRLPPGFDMRLAEEGKVLPLRHWLKDHKVSLLPANGTDPLGKASELRLAPAQAVPPLLLASTGGSRAPQRATEGGELVATSSHADRTASGGSMETGQESLWMEDAEDAHCVHWDEDQPAFVVAKDGPEGLAFLACHNFNVILSYNRYPLYGLAIAGLSQELSTSGLGLLGL